MLRGFFQLNKKRKRFSCSLTKDRSPSLILARHHTTTFQMVEVHVRITSAKMIRFIHKLNPTSEISCHKGTQPHLSRSVICFEAFENCFSIYKMEAKRNSVEAAKCSNAFTSPPLRPVADRFGPGTTAAAASQSPRASGRGCHQQPPDWADGLCSTRQTTGI